MKGLFDEITGFWSSDHNFDIPVYYIKAIVQYAEQLSFFSLTQRPRKIQQLSLKLRVIIFASQL